MTNEAFEFRYSVIPGRVLRLQHLDERFLRNVDLADAFHPLFTFFLFLEQLAFAGDIAAVAFRGHVFAQALRHFRAQ